MWTLGSTSRREPLLCCNGAGDFNAIFSTYSPSFKWITAEITIHFVFDIVRRICILSAFAIKVSFQDEWCFAGKVEDFALKCGGGVYGPLTRCPLSIPSGVSVAAAAVLPSGGGCSGIVLMVVVVVVTATATALMVAVRAEGAGYHAAVTHRPVATGGEFGPSVD